MLKYLFILIILSGNALAITNEARLEDASQEQRAMVLFNEIRCVVCSGESIRDSKADIAKSLRELVRDRIKKGDDDQQVLGYIAERYGDVILMRPPFGSDTYMLWLAPVIFLFIGAGLILKACTKR